MSTVITNRATLNYSFGGSTATAVSNLATTVLQGATALTKTSLSATYGDGSEPTYILTLTNGGETPLTGVTVTDDLGAYTLPGGGTAVPLTFIGPAKLYINGVYNSDLTPASTSAGMTFTLPEIPAGGTATLIYLAQVNKFAPLAAGSTITNTATDGDGETAEVTLDVEEYADVSVLKTMSPNPVTAGGTLTYGFDIYNYGNTEATGVVLTDTFDPAPTGIAVTVNGAAVAEGGYTYTAGLLTLPSGTGTALTVPAATFDTDPTTGEVTVTPGYTRVTVTGTV